MRERTYERVSEEFERVENEGDKVVDNRGSQEEEVRSRQRAFRAMTGSNCDATRLLARTLRIQD